MEGIWVYKALILTLTLTQSFVECRAQGLSECGTTKYSVSDGYISFPKSRSYYPNGLNCIYNLRATGKKSLTVSLLTIDLKATYDCSYEWVEIWCSSNSSDIQRICGLGKMRSISYARCNHAVIQFHAYDTRGGFNFSYAFQPINVHVRLNNTTSSNSREGRLEINYNGTWGTVCDSGFTNASARVACASLGFGYVGTVTNKSHGSGNGPIWFDDVTCFGTEQLIDECSHGSWGSHSCSHLEDVSINCALGIRLNNSTRPSNPTEGRLEVNYNGTWGTVCDKGFTHANARVVCASLGFGYISGFIGNRHGAGTGPIWLDRVYCTGKEYGLDECYHHDFGLHNCSHNNDVSINCNPSSCGKTEYSDAIGFISSPGFPNTYGYNLACTYSIKRSDQDSVTIMFPVFYIYDRYSEYRYVDSPHCSDDDWVEVQCADEWPKPNIRRYCGYNRPPALEFKSCDHVILRFHISNEELHSAFQVTYGFKPASPSDEIFAYSGLQNRSNIGQSVTCPGSSRQCNSSRASCSDTSLCCEIYNTSDQYCMCHVGYGLRRCEYRNGERGDSRQNHFEVIEKLSATPWILLSVFAILVGLSILTVLSVMIYKSCKSNEDSGDDPQTIELESHYTQPNEAEREEGGYEHIQHSSSSQTHDNHYESIS